MTRKQIQARLRALDDYEMSLHRNTWDDPDRVTDELLKVLNIREKLRAAITATDG